MHLQDVLSLTFQVFPKPATNPARQNRAILATNRPNCNVFYDDKCPSRGHWMIVESDQQLYENGRYYWTPQRAVAAWSQCYGQLKSALASGKYKLLMMLIGIPASGKSTYASANDRADIIIFDGTFVDATRRARVTSAARSAGVPVIAVWLDTNFQKCVERNQQRPVDRRVPVESMNVMLHRLNASPPQIEEGFEKIYRISA